MLRTIQCFGLARPILLFAACSFAGLLGCSGRGSQPNTTTALPLQVLPALENSHATPKKIYIVNGLRDDTLSTFTEGGIPTLPTIVRGLNFSVGVAVDTSGKIYISNESGNSVTTYDALGNPTNPTISVNEAFALAVDGNGKIYVSDAQRSILTTYNPDGSPTSPTIQLTDGGFIDGVAVNARGKIFLADSVEACPRGVGSCTYGPHIWHNYLRAYDPAGRPTSPTIHVAEDRSPINGVAVDAKGKIYMLEGPSLKTYTPRGSRTKPTISLEKYGERLGGVAVDADGKIYVTDSTPRYRGGTLTTYNPDGSPATPTITGLIGPAGVAIH